MNFTTTNEILGNKCHISGTYAYRSWCVENKNLINEFLNLKRWKNLRNDLTRRWEYPWAYSILQNKYKNKKIEIVSSGFTLTDSFSKKCKVIDIGAGEGWFSKGLIDLKYDVKAVDNYKGGWVYLKKQMAETKVELTQEDCLNLSFKDNEFDVAFMISVIEHIPTNTIYNNDGNLKTLKIMQAENKDKRQALKEAVRVIKPGGMVILTTDIYLDYLDYSDDLNINWLELVGLEFGDIMNYQKDIWVVDIPEHKGRLANIGMIIEKI